MRALVPLLMLVLATSACEREEEEPSIYRPGGAFQSTLDARGKRIVVKDSAGKALGKWRERDGRLRVYDASMVAVGEVSWEDAEKQRVRVVPTASKPLFLEKSEDGVWVLPSKLRLERVSNGWAVFDAASRRIGYVAEIEPGKFAVRDDYSSAPRAFARAGEPSVKTPAGATVVSATPETNALLLLPYALDGMDNLTRAALALWLRHAVPQEDASPTADMPDAATPDMPPSADAEVPDKSPPPQGPAQ